MFLFFCFHINAAAPLNFTSNDDPLVSQLSSKIESAYALSYLSTGNTDVFWNVIINVSRSQDKIRLLLTVSTPTLANRSYDVNFEFFATNGIESKLDLAAFSCIDKMERIHKAIPEILEEIKKEEESRSTEEEIASENDQITTLDSMESDDIKNPNKPAQFGLQQSVGATLSPHALIVTSDGHNWAGYGIDICAHYFFPIESIKMRLGAGMGYFTKNLETQTSSGNIYINYSGFTINFIEEYFFTPWLYISAKEEIHFIQNGTRTIGDTTENIISGNSLLIQLGGGILLSASEQFFVPIETGIKLDLGAEGSLPFGFYICSGVQITL